MKEAKRPGVILFFDTLSPALARLTDEGCGKLFRAIIDYAQTGTLPDLDGMAGMAFDMLRPGLDRDEKRYFEMIDQRRYAVFCRESKKRGEIPISFEDWQRMVSPDIGSYPTTTAAPASTAAATTTPAPAATATEYSSSSSTVAANATADAPGKREAEGCRGDGRENPDELFAQWAKAVNAGDKQRASELDNKLSRMGYVIDLNTGELHRRA